MVGGIGGEDSLAGGDVTVLLHHLVEVRESSHSAVNPLVLSDSRIPVYMVEVARPVRRLAGRV